jgi:hypothetical protein
VTITSATAGTTVVSATSDIPVNGQTITRTTGTAANTAAGGSDNASKSWASAKIVIAPSATNEVGHPHTFTVTLSKDSGTGSFVPAEGEHVSVTLTDSSGASHSAETGSCTTAGPNTDANGQCTITFVSSAAGKVTGHATATLTIGEAFSFKAGNRATPSPSAAMSFNQRPLRPKRSRAKSLAPVQPIGDQALRRTKAAAARDSGTTNRFDADRSDTSWRSATKHGAFDAAASERHCDCEAKSGWE